jgi:hypothetical protein
MNFDIDNWPKAITYITCYNKNNCSGWLWKSLQLQGYFLEVKFVFTQVQPYLTKKKFYALCKQLPVCFLWQSSFQLKQFVSSTSLCDTYVNNTEKFLCKEEVFHNMSFKWTIKAGWTWFEPIRKTMSLVKRLQLILRVQSDRGASSVQDNNCQRLYVTLGIWKEWWLTEGLNIERFSLQFSILV